MEQIWKLLKDSLRGTTEDLTQISFKRAVVLLSFPMVLEMIAEGVFAIVDIFFVGQLGSFAITTVGLTEIMMTVLYAVAHGLAIAASALVARRVGEKNKEAAERAAAQAIWLGIGLSAIIGILGYIFAPDLLALMGADEHVIRDGAAYTRILFSTNVVVMLIFLQNGIFRGAGNAHLTMRSVWIANAINIVLDPCFIFGIGPIEGMGVQGAAIATSIGRGVGVCYQLYHLLKGTGVIHLLRKHFELQVDTLQQLIKVGAGGSSQFFISSASWIFLSRIVSDSGTEVYAGYTVAVRVIIFCVLPAWGMSNAAAALVGQNLGAGLPDRAEKSAWMVCLYSFVFLLCISIPIFIFAEDVILLFNKTPEVVASGVDCLRTICIGYLTFAYGLGLSQAISGSGDTQTPTIINFIFLWLIQLPLAWFFVKQLEFGPQAVYWVIVFVYTIYAITYIVIFRQGKWKNVQV